MSERLRILLVEDDEDDFVMTRDLLREIPALKFDLEWIETYDGAIAALERKAHDVCLFDYRLGAHTGLELIAEARRLQCQAPMIIMTGQGDSEIDRAAMEAGASDYLVKGQVEAPLLERSIRYSLQHTKILAELEHERASLAERVEERTHELSLANVRLEHSLKANDEFLASTSHELRTPLTGILAMSEVLMEQLYGTLNEKQLEFVRNINDSGKHLLDLINDILDIAKVEAGKMELNYSEINVPQLCQAVIRLVKTPASKQGLTLELELDPAVQTLSADEKRLKQILVNLLGNAVKFTPPGGRIGLRVQGDSAAGQLSFKVWDTGIGIAKEQQELLFQPFVQLDSRLSRKYQGTGLGLALVSRMTRMHKGLVALESTVGQGSSFIVSLPWSGEPIRQATPTAPQVAEYAPGTQAKLVAPAVDAPLILLADDDRINRYIYSEYLRGKGYRIELAENGLEAIRVANDKHPRVILMDVQMPEMDGLEAIRRLRLQSEFQSTPIIALTALAMEGDREKCLEAGADLYLSKPVALKSLLKTLTELLNDDRR
ncbi:MAG: response regulator [Nitrosomonadales bacterium]|nr:response regulator [Nitrosomonadales bacterium]